MTSQDHLRIGVYIPAGCQLLDMSGIDLFGMLTPTYLSACQLPEPLVSLGIPSTIHYISVPSSGAHTELTASAFLRVTKTTEDKDVQPGMLDILLVPGPDPRLVFDEGSLSFLRNHGEWEGTNGKRTDILSVCTGIFLMGQSGLLKGRSASGPRALIPRLRKEFPETTWVDDRRWVIDGHIWSSGKPLLSTFMSIILIILSGGITNGLEMIAAYIRQKFPGPAGEAAVALAGVGDKGVEYDHGKTRETFWWLWQILRAVGIGIWKGKRA